MSNRTDPPDWLDELYQQDNAAEPPPALDKLIRAAARDTAQPWYRQTGKLAAAASVMLAAGVVTLWLNEPELRQQVPVDDRSISSGESIVVTDSDHRPAAAPAAEHAAATASPDTIQFKRQLDELRAVAPPQQEVQVADTPDQRIGQPKAQANHIAAAPLPLGAAASAVEVTDTAADLTADDGLCDQAANKTGDGSRQEGQGYGICTQDGELNLAHADCTNLYPLQNKGVVSLEKSGALLLGEDGSTWQLSCSNGEWLLTRASQQ